MAYRIKRYYGVYLIIIVMFLYLAREIHAIKLVSSSRYYAPLIYFAIILAGIIIDTRYLKRIKILWIVASILIGFNVLNTYSSTNNLYILDVKDEIRKFKERHNCVFIVDDKEIKRFKNGDNIYKLDEALENIDSLDKIKKILRQYSTAWDNQICFILYVKNNNDILHYLKRIEINNSRSISAVGIKKSGKNKSLISIIVRPNNNCEFVSGQDIEHTTKDNKIRNGDFEKEINQATFKSKFSRWINNGASFYDSDNVRFPLYSVILRTWSNPGAKYPYVCLDSNNVLFGKSSLHVAFRSYTFLYLLNNIQSQTGRLSFFIKNLGQPAELKIGRIDYGENGEYFESEMDYRILLLDKKTHKVWIDLEKSEYLGVKSLFYLSGNYCNFIIDNISFIAK